VIFTASLPQYADKVLDILDPDNTIFAKRLYRSHCIIQNQIYLKDLSRLGRKLEKILICDNVPENFKLQPKNGIPILSWYGDTTDEALA
jgi:CTD small phosphatase-like protein 2